MEVIEYIITHMDELWLIVSTIITLATLIVRLTPTQKDDEILGKIIKFIEKIANLWDSRKK